MAANSAYASARAAGQDADAAQEAADQAWTIAVAKLIRERRGELADEETNIQFDAAHIEEELRKELEALIQEEINKAEYEYWRAKNPPCPNEIGPWGEGTLQCLLLRNRVHIGLQQNGLLNFLSDLSFFFDGTLDRAQLFKTVMKSILGVDSAEECIKQRSAATCAELAIGFFPAGKAVKLVKLGKEAKNVEEAARAARAKRILAESSAGSRGAWKSEFDNLPKGRQGHVREVPDEQTMRAAFDRWTAGAEKLPARGPKVPEVYRLEDGTVIQWRTSSASGGSAIDIQPGSGGKALKVHLP